MADVYRDSYVVIVAAASKDSHGGCLIESDPDKFLRITIADQQNLYFGVRQCKFTKKLENSNDIYNDFPTYQRAWCYQEQILAQRLLYCNPQELAFQCRYKRTCECGTPTMAPHITLSHGGYAAGELVSMRDERLIATLNQIQGIPYSLADINKCWETAVSLYSRLGLKRPKDRLAALSGLAKSFQTLPGQATSDNTYLSGLWRKSIRANLLWRVPDPWHEQNGRPRTFRAPSWSWASVDTPNGVDFQRRSCYQNSWLDMSDWEGFLVDANSVPAATDTTGAVKSGFLRFETHLRRAHIRMVCGYCKKGIKHNANGKRVHLETDNWQHLCTFREESVQTFGGDFKFFNDCTLKNSPGVYWKSAIGPAKFSKRCMLAEIFLLHVAESVAQMNRVDHFLALKKAKRPWWRAAWRYLCSFVTRKRCHPEYQRIGLVVMVHRKSETRKRWFDVVWKTALTSKDKILIDLV